MRPFLWWSLFAVLQAFQPGFSGTSDGLLQEAQPPVVIEMPLGGEAVQGAVEITGSANPENFFYYELSFRYAAGEFDSWFVIVESFTPVEAGTLGEWDTFAITDGIYDLRLLVTLTDGSTETVILEGLRVRNYSLVETSTPGPPTETPTPDLTALFSPSATPTITPTPTPRATFTPLPPNPASYRPDEIPAAMAMGAAGVLALFILIGLYLSVQSIRRK